MYKKLVSAVFLLHVCACHASDSLEDMKRENERRMDDMMDRLNEDRRLRELDRANDEQERVDRIIVEGQNRKLFGDKKKSSRH